jgi:hypothetical protein
VDWLLLVVLGIMWAAFLLPLRRLRRAPSAEIAEFERRMELLAYSEVQGTNGRWIVTPRKGVRFVGTAERHRARARDRRRRVFLLILDAIGLTALIGLVPPLHAMWYGTAVLGGLLLVYVWVLLAVKHGAEPRVSVSSGAAQIPDGGGHEAPIAGRSVAERHGRSPRPVLDGPSAIEVVVPVHVVVRSAEHVGA